MASVRSSICCGSSQSESTRAPAVRAAKESLSASREALVNARERLRLRRTLQVGAGR